MKNHVFVSRVIRENPEKSSFGRDGAWRISRPDLEFWADSLSVTPLDYDLKENPGFDQYPLTSGGWISELRRS